MHTGPTLFSFPSRHHLLPDSPLTFKTSFQQPTGLHPKLQINLPRRHLTPPKHTCGLYSYTTIPSSLFIDRYQLSDRLFLDSQNLVALHILAGEQDLEAPDWVIDRWGSVALLQLGTPLSLKSDTSAYEDWSVTIPMHLRYIDGPRLPADASAEATIEVPFPTVFWACEVEEVLKMSNNPFDRVNIGYDGLFGPNTMFYHIPPESSVTKTAMEIKVPVLPKDSGDLVQLGTLLAVAMGFIWVCWQLLNAAKSKPRAQNKDRKQK